MAEYSVLMPVYAKADPEHLRVAVDSMAAQTAPSNELILVCDGPLTPGLEEAVLQLQDKYPDWLRPVQLPESKGLSQALNAGLTHCSCEIVARMDSDDISLPNRCELQLAALQSRACDIVSGTVLEFCDDPEIITARRILPESNIEIKQFARRRNPFNHPAVMYRKTCVLSLGGYGDCLFFEDYELWLKLLTTGKTGYNVVDPILKMRTGKDMYRRRGGMKYFRHMLRFEKFKHNIGFSSRFGYCTGVFARGVVALMPNFLRVHFYKRHLRA